MVGRIVGVFSWIASARNHRASPELIPTLTLPASGGHRYGMGCNVSWMAKRAPFFAPRTRLPC